MDSDAPVTLLWTCPACGRRLPQRVDVCHCGLKRPDWLPDEPVTRLAPTAPVPPPGGPDLTDALDTTPRAPSLFAVAVTLLLVLAGLLWYLRPAPVPTTPVPSAASADTTREAPGAPPAPASGPGQTARRLPTELPASPTTSAAAGRPRAPSKSVEDIVDASMPAVVVVEASAGRGSGFFVSPDLVLTNAHVAGSDYSVTLKLTTGEAQTGTVVARSSDVDLAVLKVAHPKPDQPFLTLGAARDLRVGQEVVVIGSPLGVLENSVTRGIVSAVRNVSGLLLIQTDAALNPGNSGGPMLDREGLVVGITAMKIKGQAESIGFAIVADHARALLGGASTEPVASGASPSQRLGSVLAPPKSTTEQARDEGTDAYDRTVQAVARQSDQIDDYWNRFKTSCLAPTPGLAKYDREWFCLLDSRLPSGPPSVQCNLWASDLAQFASQVRTTMTEAEEAARRADVYPGVRRDIRRKYRMDWAGWER